VQLLNQKCDVWMVNGRVYQLNAADVFDILSDKLIILLTIFIACVCATIDLHGRSEFLNIMERTGIWIYFVIAFSPIEILLYAAISLAANFVRKIFHFKRVLIPISLVSLLTCSITTQINFYLEALAGLSLEWDSARYFQEWMINWASVVAVELIVSQFILLKTSYLKPTSNENRAPLSPTEPAFPVTHAFITIDSKSYALTDVCHVAADGRFIVVHSPDGETFRHNGFLGKISQTFDPAHGVTIHRSFWVNFTSIEALFTKDRRHYCKLKSGKTLPLARNRYKDVDDLWKIWLDEQSK
jgi:hypothetical protein